MKHVTRRLISLGVFQVLLLSLWPQAGGSAAPAKKLGERGFYGSSSLDVESEAEASDTSDVEEETPEEAEARKKLEAKYPLSITAQTRSNQGAHQAFLTGLRSYYLAKSIFEAAQKISSTYDEERFTLKVEQMGVIQSRLLPGDVLQYGPDYAYVSLKIRALQEAQKQITVSISSFNKALAQLPKSKPIKEWLRISRDTLKVFKYHIRFYQLSLQNIRRGITNDQLKDLAARWNSGNPPDLKPIDTMTTSVYLGPMGAILRKKLSSPGKEESESLDLKQADGFLPTIDFKVIKH